jgi:hypothetical protein
MSYTHQFGKDGYFGIGEGPDWPPLRKKQMPTPIPPGRDDIPFNHPRRISRIAHLPAWQLALESPEVQGLCAAYRVKEAEQRDAMLVARKERP